MSLTRWTACGGCAAKWGGAPLAALVRQLAQELPSGLRRDELVVGLSPFDDAAVYRLTADLALVSTTDFFPPLVADPADFGAIAAANACSDVFAMGGRVILALNITAFPEDVPLEDIAAVLSSAGKVVNAAGGVVAGGHTVRSREPLFGLAVQGLVHPERVWRKGGARPGDHLVISKPIGTGIALAQDGDEVKAAAVIGMRALNASAAGHLHELDNVEHAFGGRVHGVTDVTGFGLAGHASEMAKQSGTSIRLYVDSVPLYQGVLSAAQAGTRTGGEARNRAYLGADLVSRVAPALEALSLDPQTSGGLLASVCPADARTLVNQGWWEIGDVLEGCGDGNTVELVY